MSKTARLWIGVTLFLVLSINYFMIGLPLLNKSAAIQEKYREIIIKQAKSADMSKNTADEYLLEALREEKGAVTKKIVLLNCVAASLSVIIVSWMMFGMMGIDKKEKQ